MRRRKQFAEFQEQVTQSIISENLDQIREIKNFDEFSSLFESLLERAESTIQRKRTEKVDPLQAPATSLKFKQVYEHKPLVKRSGQKPCEPQFSKHLNLESGVPVIDLASESESSIINLSSDSETEVPQPCTAEPTTALRHSLMIYKLPCNHHSNSFRQSLISTYE